MRSAPVHCRPQQQGSGAARPEAPRPGPRPFLLSEGGCERSQEQGECDGATGSLCQCVAVVGAGDTAGLHRARPRGGGGGVPAWAPRPPACGSVQALCGPRGPRPLRLERGLCRLLAGGLGCCGESSLRPPARHPRHVGAGSPGPHACECLPTCVRQAWWCSLPASTRDTQMSRS